MQRLNDVWRNISDEIRVHFKDNFDAVPTTPGVYAWFYPLRILTKDITVFIKQVNDVFSYDASLQSFEQQEASADFTWYRVRLDVSPQSRQIRLPDVLQEEWDAIVEIPERFHQLRVAVMRASLFMPPLYVGKAKSLNQRCADHRRGSARNSANDFHRRYAEFSQKLKLHANSVDDLIFACIKTTDQTEEKATGDRMNEVVEEILKYTCKPTYSCR